MTLTQLSDVLQAFQWMAETECPVYCDVGLTHGLVGKVVSASETVLDLDVSDPGGTIPLVAGQVVTVRVFAGGHPWWAESTLIESARQGDQLRVALARPTKVERSDPRRNARVPLNPTTHLPVEIHFDGETYSGSLRDVSHAGLSVETGGDLSLRLGAPIGVRVHALSEVHEQAGVVAWVRPGRVGIHLPSMSVMNRDADHPWLSLVRELFLRSLPRPTAGTRESA